MTISAQKDLGAKHLLVLAGLLALSLSYLAWPGRTVRAEETLRINTGVTAPYVTEDGQGFLDLVIQEVFRRQGIKARINSYAGASARSLQMSNSGTDDGEALRIAGINQKFPNLVQVPESILENHFVAYSTRHKVPTQSWDDLKPFSVAYIIGWQIFQRNVKDTKDIVTVRNPEQMFQMLNLERVDIALYEKWQGLALVRKMGIKVHVLDPPLVKMKMFMYLHKKHQGMVGPTAAALKAMKDDGAYQQIFDSKLTTLLN